MATDIDTRHIIDLPSHVEVRQHDITADDLETSTFHLVHCRTLLMHLADPSVALAKMVQAFRPSGWLLAEEADMSMISAIDASHPLALSFDAICRKSADFYLAAGIFDSYIGRRLPSLLTDARLEDVGNEAVSQVVRGGDPWALFIKHGQARLDTALLEQGS